MDPKPDRKQAGLVESLARHRILTALLVASLCPVPVDPFDNFPILFLLLLTPMLIGGVGSGDVGVGFGFAAGDVALLIALWIAVSTVVWFGITLLLRAGSRINVPWWPPSAPPAA